MKEFVSIDDDQYQKFINKTFSRYTIPKKKPTLKEFCFPEKYQLQIPQKFLAEIINPKSPYRGLMVYHNIGSGKTCAAINIAEGFRGIKKIVFVLPASLIGGLRSELRSQCAGDEYLTKSERKKLAELQPTDEEYIEIIEKSDARIDKVYTILSINKFVDLLTNDELKLRNTLLIIDEVHNIVSSKGTYYRTIYDKIHSAPKDLRLVIMTATPIFDKPIEVALTFNLLLGPNDQFPVGGEFIREYIDISHDRNGKPKYQVKNMDQFRDKIKGLVSYYRGAPAHVYPRSDVHIVKVKMTDNQYRQYRKIEKISGSSEFDFVNESVTNHFLIGTRIVSNVPYVGGIDKEILKVPKKYYLRGNLAEFSPKFAKVFKKINACKGTCFVYSNFKEYGGIKMFANVLLANGYKDYLVDGPGKKRFAMWSGDQTTTDKDAIKEVFNRYENRDGSSIKIILGSPSIKEGVSLLRVSEVHLIEPYWNSSRTMQVIGRASRFCSHKDVPEEERVVQIYVYIATHPKLKKSVDQKIMDMAIIKAEVNEPFLRALKESAIDCTLFHNANSSKDDPLVCAV
jgi:superfamily II DNA or RNA helicase